MRMVDAPNNLGRRRTCMDVKGPLDRNSLSAAQASPVCGHHLAMCDSGPKTVCIFQPLDEARKITYLILGTYQ